MFASVDGALSGVIDKKMLFFHLKQNFATSPQINDRRSFCLNVGLEQCVVILQQSQVALQWTTSLSFFGHARLARKCSWRKYGMIEVLDTRLSSWDCRFCLFVCCFHRNRLCLVNICLLSGTSFMQDVIWILFHKGQKMVFYYRTENVVTKWSFYLIDRN